MTPLLQVLPAGAAITAPDSSAASGAVPSVAALGVLSPAAAPVVTPVERRPVTPEVEEVAIPDVERREEPRLAALSAPQPVEGYGVVGATWDGATSEGVRFAVRTRTDGQWSGWQRLHGGDCPCAICTGARAEQMRLGGHAPDPGTAEARGARAGTDALVVGDVDAVQARAVSVSGEAPADLELSIVDPGQSAADTQIGAPAIAAGAADAPTTAPGAASSTTFATRTTSAAAVRQAASVSAPRPRIYSRAQWGADERMRSGSPSYGTIRAGFVHHTVNANSYAKEDVPAILRGIYAYHTQSNGWSDVGYNFLVDRFGRIWEGRYGGVTRPVVGAHTYGYNHEAFAMSAIGNLDVAKPSSAMVSAYGRLMAWKLGLHGIRADSKEQWVAGKKFSAINGHRDAGSTACPGRYLYDRLPAIRTAAANRQDGTTAPPPPRPPQPPTPPPPPPAPEPARTGPGVPRDLQADGFPDLVVRDRQTNRLHLMAGDGGPRFAARRVFTKNAGRAGQLTGIGDVTGDGRPDLLVRHDGTGVTKVRPGRGKGRFGASIAATRRFAGADVLAGVGDMIGNRRPDLVARNARTKAVWVYTGRAQGRWGARKLLIRDAGRLTMLSGAGDLDRDGRSDLVARNGRTLLLYPGRGSGRVGAARVIARGWGNKDLTVAGRDVTGDGRPDVVARDRKTRRTWIYNVRSDGTLGRRFGGWSQWADLDRLTVLGDVTGDRRPDMVARTSRDRLVVFPSLGTRWLQGPTVTDHAADNADFAQVVGDWDDDGDADVIARSAASGIVWLYRGTGDGGLRPRIRLWDRWRNRTGLVAPGDMTGDGLPDLVARDPDGAMYVVPSDGDGDGDGGHGRRVLARETMFATDLVAAAGYWNDDAARDLIVRRASSKDLYLVPGRGDGTLGRPVKLADGFGGYDSIVGVGDFNRDDRSDILARERGSGQLWLFAGGRSGLQPRHFVAAGMGRFDLIG